MITRGNLLDAGYREYPDSLRREHCLGLFQKTIWGDQGEKLYFINFFAWDFPWMKAEIAANNSHELDVHLSLPNGKEIALNYFINKETDLAEVETFYAFAFKVLGCVPDQHNN